MVEAWNLNTPEPKGNLDTVHDRLAFAKLKEMETEDAYDEQLFDDVKEQLATGLLSLADMEKIYGESNNPSIRTLLKNEIKNFKIDREKNIEKNEIIANFKVAFNQMDIPELRNLRESLREQANYNQDDSKFGYKLLALELVLSKKEKSKVTPEKKFMANYEKKIHDFELFQTNLKESIKDFENKIKDLDKKNKKDKSFWNRLFEKTKDDKDTFDYYKKVVLEPLKNGLLLVYRDYIKVSNHEPEKEDVWLRDLNKKKDINDLEIFNLQTNKLLNAFNFSICKERENPELPKDIEVEEIKNFWKQIARQRMDSRPLSDSDFSFNFPTLLKLYNIVKWGDVIDASMVVWYLHNHPALTEDFSQYKKYKLASLKKTQIDDEIDAQSKGFASYMDMLMSDSHANKLLEQEINRQRVEVGERPVTSSLKREDEVYIKSDLEELSHLAGTIKHFKL
jgi:hypothetical protein